MEINDIAIFMALYRNRSITKTAELLHYTQSNVSTRLMKLEKEFHVLFFSVPDQVLIYFLMENVLPICRCNGRYT